MSHTRTQTIFAFVTILASLAVLTTNQPLSAQGITHAEIAAIDSIFQPWNDPAGPGAAVAVTRNGRLIYSQGYGSAQLEYQIPITPTTIFHIASISKHFTTFAVGLLAREGKLSWEDEVDHHIPELPDLGHTFTLRQLANHTSGIRDQWQLMVMAGWRMDDVITHDQIMRMMMRQRELNFTPGTRHLYSNMGFSLLAEVVERVSGQPLGDFLEERVFLPLGMHRTHVHSDHTRIVPGRAYSYAPLEGSWSATNERRIRWRKAPLNYANRGATSLFTTVEDLARWITAEFEGPTIGDDELWTELRERAILTSGDTVPYGLGLAVDEYRGLRTVGHGGSDAGFRTHLLHFPDYQLGIIVFSNSSTFNSAGTARRVAEVFLEDQMEPPIEVAAQPRSEHSKDPDDVVFTNTELREYEGSYYSPELETTYHLRVEGDELIMRHQRHPDLVLSPIDNDHFMARAIQMRTIEFTRDQGGRVDGFRASGGRVLNLRFDRVETLR